jgi:hypothetical protein
MPAMSRHPHANHKTRAVSLHPTARQCSKRVNFRSGTGSASASAAGCTGAGRHRPRRAQAQAEFTRWTQHSLGTPHAAYARRSCDQAMWRRTGVGLTTSTHSQRQVLAGKVRGSCNLGWDGRVTKPRLCLAPRMKWPVGISVNTRYTTQFNVHSPNSTAQTNNTGELIHLGEDHRVDNHSAPSLRPLRAPPVPSPRE